MHRGEVIHGYPRKELLFIAPIGEEGSDTRRRSDQVLRYVVRRALEPLNYLVVRADEIDRPGLITTHIIQRVANDHLVVADLTESNPNVFYELALRHAIRKPLIQILQRGERLPFDVAGLRTIIFDFRDLESVEEAVQNIQRQVAELEANPEDIETPLSVAMDVQRLRYSEIPEERRFADIIEGISELKVALQNSLHG